MKYSGIYKIQSVLFPDRIYIGSSVNIRNRWRYHRDDLKKGKHHSSKLQRHYNKYGENDLDYRVLLSCEKEELLCKEQYFIDVYNPYFNISPTAYSPLGVIRSDETKRLISINHADVNGCKNPMYGKPPTEEHRKKISENHADISGSRNPMFGRKHSDETKEKIRQKRLGKSTRTGCKHTEETKKKISLLKRERDRLKQNPLFAVA